ncbi:MAG: VOC family protein [Mycobacteriales bacterium]|jgi:catechol 2,3-dioxygenase-like lactoylglutathione lyase family enzyme
MFTDSMPNLYIADMDAALGFYRDLLGFERTYQYPASGPASHVELRLGASHLALSTATALRDHGLPPASPGQPFEIAIGTGDVELAVRTLRAAGVTVLREPFVGSVDRLVAYVLDPDGNRIHLYATC